MIRRQRAWLAPHTLPKGRGRLKKRVLGLCCGGTGLAAPKPRFQTALQPYFLHPAGVGFFDKLIQPVFAQDVPCHFDDNVVGGQVVVVGVAA